MFLLDDCKLLFNEEISVSERLNNSCCSFFVFCIFRIRSASVITFSNGFTSELISELSNLGGVGFELEAFLLFLFDPPRRAEIIFLYRMDLLSDDDDINGALETTAILVLVMVGT